MVTLSTVRANNSALKDIPNLVAVFVGGTSGIGLTTAREFIRNTTSPTVYLIGRNQTEATKLITELQTLNPSSRIDFIKSDVSLLRNVDSACQEIASKESKVNLLFLSAGLMTIKGRTETPEGLDKKFSLHYYSRLRFTERLLPLLTQASERHELSRVVAVLDAHARNGSSLNYADLSLKKNFTLASCAYHATSMTNLSFEHLAAAFPGTAFVHSYPGGVNTNLLRSVNPLLVRALGVVLKPFMVDVKESGERHLWAGTSGWYAPKGGKAEREFRGSEGVGSGAYWLHWDGEAAPESTFRRMGVLRGEGAVGKVWGHTEEVFRTVCEEGGKY